MKIWILVHKDDTSNFAFGIGRTAAEAYRICGELFGGIDRPWTTEQIKELGYKAVKADVVLR